MASVVKIKRSAVAGKVPTTSNIEAGELALNTADKVLYSTDGSVVFEVGANVDYQTVNTAIDFLGSAHGTVTAQEGRIYYDTTHKTLTAFSDTGLEMELGQQEYIRVYNNTGSQINLGQPVYMTGVHTDDETPTAGLGDATDMNKYNISGLAAENIADSSFGYVAASGVVHGFDTTGLTAGDRVFLGLTPGALQTMPPVYPNFPMCIGYVITSDASDGEILVEMQNHTVKSFRVVTDQYIGGDLTISGDLTVQGTQQINDSTNIQIASPYNYFNAGDTIGEAGTSFTGTGNDDGTLVGHFKGASSTTYYVRIDGVGTGTGGVDTFEWSKDNFSTTEATGVDITGAEQALDNGIKIEFATTTAHTLNDVWYGTAGPSNVDTGIFSNRNTGASGVGYTHIGLFFDVDTEKWQFVSEYDPEPEGTINIGHASFNASGAVVAANTFEGDLTGNAGTATALETGRTISITGDVSYTSGTFNGTGNVTGTGTIQTGSGTTVANYMQVANTNLLVNDRMQVANTVALTDALTTSVNDRMQVANTVLLVNDRMQVANTTLLVNDRMQVANVNSLITNVNTNLGQKLGATATVTLTGDVTASSTAFSANAVSIATTLSNSGVTASTYGSGSAIPVITVDAKGRITSATTSAVAGVSDVTYTPANNTLTVSTADGSEYDTEINTSKYMEVANTNTLVNDRMQVANTVALTDALTTSVNDRMQVANTVLLVNDRMQVANVTSAIDTAISNLVDSAPTTLDTLNELAAALGDNPNFATTVTTNLGQKLGATASVTLTGAVTGSASFSANAVSIATTVNHNHDSDYVNVSGDTMTGALTIQEATAHQLRLQDTSGNGYELRSGTNFIIRDDSTERMRIDSNGNVGIGTTSPQGVLDLGNGTGGKGIVWGGTDGTSHYNSIWSEYSSASIVIGAGLKGSTNSQDFIFPFTGTYGYAAIELDSFSDDGIKFYTAADGSRTEDAVATKNERMRITTDGNVGIGTGGPTTNLYVAETGASTNNTTKVLLTLDHHPSTTPVAGFGSEIQFRGKNPGNGGSVYGSIAAVWEGASSNPSGGTLQFKTDGYSGGNTTRMTIDSQGRVGIGTTTPSTALDVDGALSFVTNNVTVSGASTTIDLTASNFHIVTMGASTTFSFSNLSNAIASSGTIIIKQNSTGGYSFTLPSECKTPIGGASISQETGADTTSILSYVVVSASEVLVNYVGDFA